jgi:hypothetical protein
MVQGILYSSLGGLRSAMNALLTIALVQGQAGVYQSNGRRLLDRLMRLQECPEGGSVFAFHQIQPFDENTIGFRSDTELV